MKKNPKSEGKPVCQNSYTGVLRKSSSIPGQPANFAKGFKVEGFFELLPLVGAAFFIYPSVREYFHTSIVQNVVHDTNDKYVIETLNSNYELTITGQKGTHEVPFDTGRFR